MVLVIDEYGGVDGLVIIEDLIEQVIGVIEDEYDEIEDGLMVFEVLGCWMIQLCVFLEVVECEIGLWFSLEDDEIDMLGGLIFMLIGWVFVVGEIIFYDSGVEFEIFEIDFWCVCCLCLCVFVQEVSV